MTMRTQAKAAASGLPFGLKRYRPGQFDKFHAPGSGLITASGVPALFGHSRFNGRYSLAAHVSGKAAMTVVENSMMEWGRRFETPMLEKAAEDMGWRTKQLRAYARHPEEPRIVASPDGLAWALDDPDLGPGQLECKVVADWVYDRDWLPANEPPLEVLLQHQTQYACTGATWGAILALVLGSTKRDFIVFMTVPNAEVMALILEAARTLLSMLDAGRMPDPDDHPASIDALQKIYPSIDPGLIRHLDGEEAVRRFDAWKQARLDKSAAIDIEEAARNWFLMQDPGAGAFRIGNDREVICRVIQRGPGKPTPPGSYRRFDLKRASGANHLEPGA